VIEVSVARRVRRGLALWRSQGTEIRPMPAGGLSVPSCSEPGRSYRVSLAGEGRCGCPTGVAARSHVSTSSRRSSGRRRHAGRSSWRGGGRPDGRPTLLPRTTRPVEEMRRFGEPGILRITCTAKSPSAC
jgi:hypothetical protein